MNHSTLSPSAARRWMSCPGSVRACADVPDLGSEEADQGTACHMLLARHLRGGDSKSVSKVTIVNPGTGRVAVVEVTPEMRGWVRDAEVYVWHYIDSNPMARLRVEAFCPVGRYFGVAGDLFGHSDVVLVTQEELVVIDAKFGRVEVEGEDNPQLSLYAIGHAEEYGWNFERYKLAVLQPRSPNPVKVEVLTASQLRDRADRYKRLVAEALQPDAALVPGDHCASTYCPAAGICRALMERTQALVGAALRGPAHLTPAELGAVLDGAKLARKALDGAERHALGQLAFGVPVPGWKRVMTEGHRQWKDETEAATLLRALGVEPFKKVLLSPNQAEEELGEHGGLLTPYAPKAKGHATLARENDPRPALEADDGAFDNEE